VTSDVAIAGSEQLSLILPIIDPDSQKEKGNIFKDIEDMLKKEFEKNITITPVEVINIVFGIAFGEGKNPHYS
jgi:hypothetical protein